MKEANGYDHLAIAWQYPGQALEVIPAWFSRTTRPGWPAACTVDSDCDDGVWCNGKLFCHKCFSLFVACRTLVDILSLKTGDEKCDATKKACQYGTQQTCADGLSCTDDICNELTKSCDNPTTSCRGSDDPCATGQCIESLGGCQFTCGATWDTWVDIDGWGVPALMSSTNNLANPPNKTERLLLEAPDFYDERFGSRMKGWLVPPVSGDYTFWIAADDMGEFWLSIDDEPANKVLECYTPGPVSRYFFSAYSEQKSEPVTLEAGLVYYFEVRVCANL